MESDPELISHSQQGTMRMKKESKSECKSTADDSDHAKAHESIRKRKSNAQRQREYRQREKNKNIPEKKKKKAEAQKAFREKQNPDERKLKNAAYSKAYRDRKKIKKNSNIESDKRSQKSQNFISHRHIQVDPVAGTSGTIQNVPDSPEESQSFPMNRDLRRKWIDSTGRPKWFPTRTSTICTEHFESNDVLTNLEGYSCLAEIAIPNRKVLSFQENVIPTTELPPQVSRISEPIQLSSALAELQKVKLELNNALCGVHRILESLQENKMQELDEFDLYGKLLAKKLREFSQKESNELINSIDGLMSNRMPGNNDPLNLQDSVVIKEEEIKQELNSVPIFHEDCDPTPSPS